MATTRTLIVPRGANSQRIKFAVGDREVAILDLQALNHIERFEPSDYYITCQAGMHLADLEAILTPKRLHFPFLTPGTPGTVGGMVASGQILALGEFYNISRWVLALRVITASGELIKAGAVTYKSVAGYDLPKLFCRSFGTLGVITAVSLRLYPIGSQPFGKDMAPAERRMPTLVTLEQVEASHDGGNQVSLRIKQAFDPNGIFPACGGWNA